MMEGLTQPVSRSQDAKKQKLATETLEKDAYAYMDVKIYVHTC